MIKSSVLIIVVLTLCSFQSSFAASVSDSIIPLGNLNAAISLEYNYINDIDLAKDSGLTSAETSDLNQVYAKAILGLGDYANVYGKVGITANQRYYFETADENFKYEADPGLLLGGGIAGAYEFYQDYRIAGDISVNSWRVDIDSAKYNGATGQIIAGGEVDNYEFQASLALSRDFNWDFDVNLLLGERSYEVKTVITPYIGCGYMYFNTKTKETLSYLVPGGWVLNSWDQDSERNFFGLCGVTAKIYDNFRLNLEGRFGAQNALGVGASYTLSF